MVKKSDSLLKFSKDFNSLSLSAVYLHPEDKSALKVEAPLAKRAGQIVLEGEPIESLPTLESHLYIDFPITRKSSVTPAAELDITDLLSSFWLELASISPAKSKSIAALSKVLDEIEATLAAGEQLADEIETMLNTQA